jgi:thiol-disulfide isomerase/thioredoxin
MEAPTLTGIDLAEQPITIEPGGTPKILLFLAHWCPHCQAEVPRMVDYLSETGGVDGVDFYGITTSTDRLRTNYPPSAWLERENWQAPVMLDDEQSRAGLAYGVNAFPFWVVLDSEGKVALRLTGELDRQGIEQIFTFASGL